MPRHAFPEPGQIARPEESCIAPQHRNSQRRPLILLADFGVSRRSDAPAAFAKSNTISATLTGLVAASDISFERQPMAFSGRHCGSGIQKTGRTMLTDMQAAGARLTHQPGAREPDFSQGHAHSPTNENGASPSNARASRARTSRSRALPMRRRPSGARTQRRLPTGTSSPSP